MKFERFEDIFAWQKAKELTKDIYLLFSKSNDFGFKDHSINNEQHCRRI